MNITQSEIPGISYMEYRGNKYKFRDSTFIAHLAEEREGSLGRPPALLPPNTVMFNGTDLLVLEPPAKRLVRIRHRSKPSCECVYEMVEIAPENFECGCGEAPEDCCCEREAEQRTHVCELCKGQMEFAQADMKNDPDWGEYYLAFPWMLYYFKLRRENDLSNYVGLDGLFTMKSPTSSFMYSVPLPNCYHNGNICQYLDPRSKNTVNKLMSDLWGSAFNYDVLDYQGSNFWHLLSKEVKEPWIMHNVFKKWEEKSKIDDFLPFCTPLDRIWDMEDLISTTRHQHSFYSSVNNCIKSAM